MKKILKTGDVFSLIMPFRDGPMHLGIEGQERKVRMLNDGVQVLDDNEQPFGSPISFVDAGLYFEDGSWYRFAV